MEKYKYLILIGIILSIFLTLSYLDTREFNLLSYKHSELEKQFITQRENIILLEQFRKKEKDSLLKVINIREAQNNTLRLADNKVKTIIKTIQAKPLTQVEDSKSFEEYLEEKYCNDYQTVVTELEEGKKCTEIALLKDWQIQAKDIIIANLEFDKLDLKNLAKSSEITIVEQQKLLDLTDKELKKKNFFLKYVVPPLAFLIGGVILSK
jgi:hypothetical protein